MQTKSWSGYINVRQNNWQSKETTMNKEGHYIMIRGPIRQEDITILNVHALNNRASKYMQQKLLELNEKKRTNPLYKARIRTKSKIQSKQKQGNNKVKSRNQ